VANGALRQVSGLSLSLPTGIVSRAGHALTPVQQTFASGCHRGYGVKRRVRGAHLAPWRRVKPHIVLIGDSIFDNGAYTRGEPDVVTHLARLIPQGWEATSFAVDGATTAGVAEQLRRIPPKATHLAVAIGGNDVLQHVGLLSSRVTTMVEALEMFAPHVDRFQQDYVAAIESVRRQGLPVIVCTIYNGRLEPTVVNAARMALALFNDVILRTAISSGLAVLELRDICTTASDYANPIEPSGSGGMKIAAAIGAIVDRLSSRAATP
jgi:hypothetical protein